MVFYWVVQGIYGRIVLTNNFSSNWEDVRINGACKGWISALTKLLINFFLTKL